MVSKGMCGGLGLIAVAVLVAAPSRAEESAGQATAGASAELSLSPSAGSAVSDEESSSGGVDSSEAVSDEGAKELDGSAVDGRGSLLLAAKVGGVMPFNGLSPFVSGGAQLGWVFGGPRGNLAAWLDVTVTSPSASGEEADARLAGGSYSWEIAQQELVLQPTIAYRFTDFGDLIPSVGIGPRVYLLETQSEGRAGGETILESKEQSTKFGVGLPIAVDYPLGPGHLMGEALFEWAPLDHRITGDASLLGANVFLGYRALL